MIVNAFYRCAWKLFRIPSVVLIDFDGQPSIRFVHRRGARAIAKRFGLGVATVYLQPDGSTRGVSYVHAWEPAFPQSFSLGA